MDKALSALAMIAFVVIIVCGVVFLAGKVSANCADFPLIGKTFCGAVISR